MKKIDFIILRLEKECVIGQNDSSLGLKWSRHMRRAICYCEPSHALAGEMNTWKFVYSPSVNLPKGTKFKFDLMSKGRDIDWQIPSVNLKKSSNIIYAHLESGKILQAKEVDNPDSCTPDFEFVLSQELPAGSSIAFIVGAPPEGDEVADGNRSQCTAQRRRTFKLQITTGSKGQVEEPELFTMDIRGNVLQNIRILTPSFVARNKRFDVIVRFEDEFGNLTSNAPDDTLIELSHEHLRENLKWKLFIPETGFISLPNLYFNEPGVYTVQLYNTMTKEVFRSSPIKCFSDNNMHLFWGTLHGESERFDSTENIESCLRHFRDEKAHSFFSSSCFESQEETSNDTWKLISQNIAEFDETDRFTTFLGFQWEGEPTQEGLRQIIYTKDNKPLLRKKEAKNSSLQKIYKSFSPKEIISIPCFTAGKGMDFNFDEFTPEFERVVEIYNAWGSSENTKKEGNTRPIQTKGKTGAQEFPEGTIQRALLQNHRFGFVAGGLDDRGAYSEFYEGDQTQYSPGLTAIIAQEHSRTSIAEALYNRSCYATTGERIIIGLSLAGAPMGSEMSTATKPGLFVNRHLAGYVAGTTDIKSVEIIRNGKVIKSYEPESGYTLDFTYDDMTPIEKIAINIPKNKAPPFVYYYLRITQVDGHIGWSSPIWVDVLPASKEPIKRATKPVKKPVVITEVDDEEDEDDEE